MRPAGEFRSPASRSRSRDACSFAASYTRRRAFRAVRFSSADTWKKLRRRRSATLFAGWPLCRCTSRRLRFGAFRKFAPPVGTLPKRPELVIIDPLRAVYARGRSDAAVALRKLARQLDVAVVVLERTAGHNRRGAEPTLDAIPIEIRREASLILSIHRPGYYWLAPDLSNLSEAFVYVLRNEHGGTGAVELRWVPETSSFR